MNKIPHITPNFFRPPKKSATPERYLLFLRTRLLEHKPGTTHEEIFNMEVELLESEMMSLMQTDACPNLVKEEFSETQTETPEPEEEPELPVQPDVHISAPQYEDWAEILLPPPRNSEDEGVDEVNSQGSDGDYSNFVTDNNYDWNTQREQIGIDEQELPNLPNWIKNTKV